MQKLQLQNCTAPVFFSGAKRNYDRSRVRMHRRGTCTVRERMEKCTREQNVTEWSRVRRQFAEWENFIQSTRTLAEVALGNLISPYLLSIRFLLILRRCFCLILGIRELFFHSIYIFHIRVGGCILF